MRSTALESFRLAGAAWVGAESIAVFSKLQSHFFLLDLRSGTARRLFITSKSMPTSISSMRIQAKDDGILQRRRMCERAGLLGHLTPASSPSSV